MRLLAGRNSIYRYSTRHGASLQNELDCSVLSLARRCGSKPLSTNMKAFSLKYLSFKRFLITVPVLFLTALATEAKPTDFSPKRASERGIASFYADKHHGKVTANGEIFNM